MTGKGIESQGLHVGDNVTIVGGQNHHGIVHHNYAPQRTLEEQLTEVVRLAQVLRGDVSDAADRAALDGALPALAADAATEPATRRRSLMALAAIAATIGTVGEPLLNSVKAALELLGS